MIVNLPEKEIQTILSGIKDFVLIISPEKEIMETNAAFLNQVGCSREEVIGRKCYEVLKEDQRENSNCLSICPLEEAIKNKKTLPGRIDKAGQQWQAPPYGIDSISHLEKKRQNFQIY